MDLEKLDTQNKIIATAIEMIGKQVNLNFTVREIAEKADVNLSSVNYYFRSKENLINEIEQYFANEISLLCEELLETGIDPYDKIIRWSIKTMTYLMEFPGVLFMMASKLIYSSGKSAPGITELVKRSEESLSPAIKALTGISDDEIIALKGMQLMSGIITPVLIYHGVGIGYYQNIKDSRVREKYIKLLVKSIITV